MTEKQTKDIETIRYFIPDGMKKIPITQKDINDFLLFSERGVKRENQDETWRTFDGYHALLQGKRWRGIHMEMYEQGVLEGSMPYIIILNEDHKNTIWEKIVILFKTFRWKKSQSRPIPRSVMEFMKKEMFRGIDAGIIERAYSIR